METRQAVRKLDLLHIGFEIGLFLKAFIGVLEAIGGGSLLFLNQQRLDRLLLFVMRLEWSEDRRDWLVDQLTRMLEKLSVSSLHFEAFYLIAHGALKIALVTLLWRKKSWAYPLTVCVFLLLVAYQLYRFTVSGSAYLLVLSGFDLVMVALTLREYLILRRQRV
jgi:uncharacterized membrane protein